MKFDEFLHDKDMMFKYAEIRKYFGRTNSYKEAEEAKAAILDGIKTKNLDYAPADVIDFFYKERCKTFGPRIDVRDEQEKARVEAIPGDVQRKMSQSTMQNRPSMV